MHEVAQGVEGFGLPVHRGAALLVDRGAIAGVLDVQRLEVVHGPGYQVTWGTVTSISKPFILSMWVLEMERGCTVIHKASDSALIKPEAYSCTSHPLSQTSLVLVFSSLSY